jgi:hypothetical protein
MLASICAIFLPEPVWFKNAAHYRAASEELTNLIVISTTKVVGWRRIFEHEN